MSREIKFRGKDSDTGEWRYGYYVQHEKVTLCPVYENKEAFEKAVVENTEHYIIFDGFSDWNMTRAFYRADVDGKTVGQYTGMKDCNGTEIYESDIVRIHGEETGRIVWDEQEFTWAVIVKRIKNCLGVSYWSSSLEVIGNIYDNPELIGGAADD